MDAPQRNTILTFSWNNLSDFELYEAVARGSDLPYPLPLVEILWDNYCHLPPEQIAKFFAPIAEGVALHIMWSRFIERSPDEVQEYLDRLARHVAVLQPIYVSDHLCDFTVDGLYAPYGLEHDYRDMDRLVSRVLAYQEALGRPVMLENYASTAVGVARQIDAFELLMRETGCGILFDISNAYAAELNGVVEASRWFSVLEQVPALRCHVGSYSFSAKLGCYLDTHGSAVSTEVAELTRTVTRVADVASVCYERDFNQDCAAMVADLHTLDLHLSCRQEAC